MEKSNIDKVKDLFLYAPVGAVGFMKDNAPTFFSMFVSRGRRDVTKTTIQAEEKIESTKHHGKIVAMGTPVAKTRAEKLAGEAKVRGQDVASTTFDLAMGALGIASSVLGSAISTLTEDRDKKDPMPESSNLEVDEIEKIEKIEPNDIATENQSLTPEKNEFVAEPLSQEVQLPKDIRVIYEKLSAPEIIDRLDDFTRDELHSIIKYELNYRNRQTIIHAINYRLVGQN